MKNLHNLKKFLNEQEEEAKGYLQRMVNTDSNSYDKDGVNKVGGIIHEYLDKNDIPYEVKENNDFGNHIIATVKGTKSGKILLMGHQDTVFPKGTASKRPYHEEGKLAYGPGVSDMKASLVSMLVVTSVIKRLALDEMYDIELLFTPDEEIGSPISHAIIQERTKDAVGVFNMEPARPSGAIVTARKGSAHMRFDIDGKASHSGLAIEEGISAIDELAYKIIKIKELMDLDKGLTVNIGTVQGGTTNNTVAPNAMGTIHSGYRRIKDYENLKEQIQNIVNQSFVEGTKSRVEIGAMILPMEKTVKGKQMYEIVKESANLLGIPITETETKGAADAGFAASLGVPTICGMGPVGGKWHSTEEYLELDSFIPRMQLLAVSIILYSRFAK